MSFGSADPISLFHRENAGRNSFPLATPTACDARAEFLSTISNGRVPDDGILKGLGH